MQRLYESWKRVRAFLAARRGRAVIRLADAIGAGRATLVATHTRVDVGAWGWRGRVTVGLLGDELLLLAPGRRPVVARARRADLAASLYNAVTGELILAPGGSLRQRTLRLPLVEGYAILQWVREWKGQEAPGAARENDHA